MALLSNTFNTTKRKCNWHVYYIKKVQNIVFKVVARASEAQIAIKAIKLDNSKLGSTQQ